VNQQNYKNHIRFYPAHHYVFYPLASFLFCLCLYFVFNTNENLAIWLVMSVVILLMIFLSLLLRQHYALLGQNRTIRLEMRLRYFILTQKRFEDVEARLSLQQIYALRFAADEELVALVERAVKENLTPNDIKKAIKQWLPDNMRA